MKTVSKPMIVVIDDNVLDDDPLMVKLKEIYETKLINNSIDGANYLKKHFEEKIIVILDIKFSTGEPNGHYVLEELRKFTYLVPVIVVSALDEDTVGMTDFINKKTFAFIRQTADYDTIISKVKEAEAYLNMNVATAIEDWLLKSNSKSDKTKAILTSKSGKSYTLEMILDEIRHQTDFGIEIEKDIQKLTIDLLYRGKETLR